MTLKKRISRIVRANINSWLAEKEQPERAIQDTVADLETNLSQLRSAIASGISTLKRTERQLTQAQALADQWYRRAEAALKQGNEALAEDALWQRQSYLRSVPNLLAHQQEQQRVINKLKQDLRVLELKVSESQMIKDMYIVRSESALIKHKTLGSSD
jgi:phage shock protein A